jgi:hypothetical protein
MLSDSGILDELDNILANEESDDEFLDNLCFDDDDSGNYNTSFLFVYYKWFDSRTDPRNTFPR